MLGTEYISVNIGQINYIEPISPLPKAFSENENAFEYLLKDKLLYQITQGPISTLKSRKDIFF